MAKTFSFQGPDGKTHTIEGPEDATPEQAFEILQSQLGARPSAPPPQTAPASIDQRTAPPATPQRAGPTVGMAGDVARSLGSGIVRGGMGVAALPGTVEWLGRKGLNMAGAGVSEDTTLPTFDDIKGAYEGVAGRMYEPQTTAGKYARTVGEFAPGMLFPGGMAQRVLGNVVAPAVASETAGQMTEGTAAEPYARIVGGMAGAVLPGMASRAVSPVTAANPERTRLANVLDQEGVTSLTAGQRTGSKPLRWTESAIGDMPFTGGRAPAMMAEQSEQFTRAALRRAGINAPRATTQVIDDAFTTLGQQFDALAQQSTVPVSRQMVQDAQRIAQEYAQITPQAMQAPIIRELADNISQLAGQQLTGQQYATWRSTIGRAMRGAQANPQLQRGLGELLELLDDGVAAAMPQQVRQQWQQTRGQYRNLLAIERAATGAGEAAAEGLISPSALRQAVTTMHGRRNYARGQGDLAELARAGEAIMKPLPQSGTAPRAGVHTVMTLGGGVAAGAPGSIVGFAAPPLLGRAMMSRPAQAYLSNQAAVPLRQAVNPRQSMMAQTPAMAVAAGEPAGSEDPVMLRKLAETLARQVRR